MAIGRPALPGKIPYWRPKQVSLLAALGPMHSAPDRFALEILDHRACRPIRHFIAPGSEGLDLLGCAGALDADQSARGLRIGYP